MGLSEQWVDLEGFPRVEGRLLHRFGGRQRTVQDVTHHDVTVRAAGVCFRKRGVELNCLVKEFDRDWSSFTTSLKAPIILPAHVGAQCFLIIRLMTRQ